MYLMMVIYGLLSLCCLTSCLDRSAKKVEMPADFDPAYSLYLINDDGSTGFQIIDSSWQKSYEVAVPYPQFSREFIQRKGYFYHVNPLSNNLIQLKLTATGFKAIDSVALINTNIENFLWKNDTDTLVLLNIEKGRQDTTWFYEISTQPLSLVRKGIVPIPSAMEDFNLVSIGLSQVNKDDLWIAYSYNKILGVNDYTTSDTMYFATYDLQNLELKNLQKDSRSTYPGGINTVQSYGAYLPNEDYYFMSCPGIALGNNLALPTAIFRKKKGSEQVDTTYMLNISDSIGNHAYGLWHIQGDQVIVRSERKDKYTDFSNHHAVFQFDYYLLDVKKGSFERIDLPLDKGTRKENVLVRNKKVYFGIDDEKKQHRVLQYDPQTGKVHPIFTSTLSTSYILRLDWLKN